MNSAECCLKIYKDAEMWESIAKGWKQITCILFPFAILGIWKSVEIFMWCVDHLGTKLNA